MPLARPLVAACLAAAALLSSPAAHAEPTRRMTLDEATAYAKARHTRALAARQRAVAASKDVDAISAQWLPRLGAMAQLVGSTTNNSTSTLLGQTAVDLPRIGATRVQGPADFQPYASSAAGLGVRQELYDFGRIASERAASALLADVEAARTTGVEVDVAYGVAQAYYAALAAAAVEEASRAAFTRASTHRDFARANVASGLRPPIELTRAEADVARYEAGMTRATGARAVARTVFAAAVGVDDYELDAAGPGPRGGALPTLVDAVQHAEATPTAREGRARLLAQQAETRRLEAQTRPNLFATASVSGRAGGATPTAGPVPFGDGVLPVVPNYDLGVVLTWSLFEPTWSKRADASREREAAARAESDYALRTQRAVIAAAWHEARMAAETLAALERAEMAARANYDQADNRFRVGLGTSTELADAQALRAEAEIQLAIGHFQVSRARATLDRALSEVSK